MSPVNAVQQPLERVVIVDDANRVVSSVTRAELREQNLTHRASFVFVHNSSGQLFVQQRVSWKETYPSHHDPAPGGVVGADETYEENAARELQEEMGIPAATAACAPEALFDFFYGDATTRVWGRAFRCVYDGPLELQASEVASGQWLSLDLAMALHPCCPDSRMALQEYVRRMRSGDIEPLPGTITRAEAP
jgi:isopentenyldiphosphate isomerase